MRITALIAVSAAALALVACGDKAEEAAPEATSEAVEASGIADQAAVTVTEDQAAADAKAAAEAAAASEVAQADPVPATPVEAH